MERHALARAGTKLPDYTVGQPFEVATGAALPTLARKPVAKRVRAGNRVEVAARGEKHFRADEVRFSRQARRRQVGSRDHGNDGVIGEIYDGDIARDEISDVSKPAVAGDGYALGIFARVGAAGGGVGRVVQVD